MDIEKVFNEYFPSLPSDITKEVFQAFLFAEKSHRGQYRKSGEEYIFHPLFVAQSLWSFYQDKDLLISGLLHDVVEDCPEVDISEIYEQFSSKVGFIVDSLDKNKQNFYQYPSINYENKLDRFLWAGSKNIKVFLVKLADRSHNISTLTSLNKYKQINISFETQAIYEPLKIITSFNKVSNLQKVEKDVSLFFETHKLDTPAKKRSFLMERSFQNVSDELFGLIKKDIKSVVWSLDDYDTFKKITTDKLLVDNIQLLKIIDKSGKFTATFKFNKSFEFSNLKLNPKTFTL